MGKLFKILQKTRGKIEQVEHHLIGRIGLREGANDEGEEIGAPHLPCRRIKNVLRGQVQKERSCILVFRIFIDAGGQPQALFFFRRFRHALLRKRNA